MKSNKTYIYTIKRLFIAAMMIICAMGADAQQLQTVYTVKKGETLYAIAKKYGVTLQELISVNPAMQKDGYVLAVGAKVNIPVAGQKTTQTVAASQQTSKPQQMDATTAKTVVVGIMLPLHDINGDGRRMVEYYRGMLLALEDLKSEGVNVEMNAWNVPEDGDVATVLAANRASKCDVIFGPLYTKQVPEMSQFCKEHNIRLVIPFSINGSDVKTCPNVYQVYQTPDDINTASVNYFMQLFGHDYVIFVDCNDATSKKGVFTNALRSALENNGVQYSVTNVKNELDVFAKAFVVGAQNVVVLNTGRSPELGQTIQLLDQLTAKNPQLKITLFGYNEWFMYAKVYQDKFKKYDAYVPSVYDYNAQKTAVQNIEKKYKSYFGQEMMQAIPRFAITGYDQLMFFVKGIEKYGDQFHGLASQKCYTPIQTPFSFEKYANGGYQNKEFMLVKYK